jgi:hypothetical protein
MKLVMLVAGKTMCFWPSLPENETMMLDLRKEGLTKTPKNVSQRWSEKEHEQYGHR